MNAEADFTVPDGADPEGALARCTHLCVGAHQDDIEVMAYHGIAACYDRPDGWFGGVVVTNGAGSPRTGPYAAYTDEEMQGVRRDEQRKAAEIGKYSFQAQLAYPSSAVKDAANLDTVAELRVLFEKASPEVLYLHNPADKHDTHIAVLHRCIQALRELPRNRRPAVVYGCEGWRDLDWLPDELKCILPAEGHGDLPLRLLQVFDSQVSGGKRYDRAVLGRRCAHATFQRSHEPDAHEAVTLAMDLGPLLENPDMLVEDFAVRLVESFKEDVRARVRRFK